MLSSTIVNANRVTPSVPTQPGVSPVKADRDPVPIARPEIHETVARVLDPLPRGKLLDVPAGEGALSARLSQAGFLVQACDLYPDIFVVRDIEVRRGDLSGSLPYADCE